MSITRRSLIATGAAAATVTASVIGAGNTVSGETKIAALYRRLLEQRQIAENSDDEDLVRAVIEIENEILDLPAASPDDARIQLVLLRETHEGSEYNPRVVDAVVASVLDVLTPTAHPV